MTTYIAFQPQANTAPPFQTPVTLDGTTYNLVCWWNIYRAGYYYTITDQGGMVIYTGALVGSPTSSNIYLAPGIFQTSTMLYRSGSGNFEINP
jgi:hypothetical protein